ncbi:MAG: hypothetical protein ACD_72C00491G0002 [uncultured bacterium]|nr:MAG: hypothetical protein ACD_72C00491G0002 [uncultured bacterium]
MITPQTTQPKLAKSLGLSVPLYFKREDLHPLGSHKGRSIPVMIERYITDDFTNFVISSSGNAALAAGLFIKKYNQTHKNKLVLQIFVGENIDKAKLGLLKKIQSKNVIINKTKNPKQQAFQLDKDHQAKILRQSTDDTALLGYEQLAKELSKIENLSAVFIPTSSGTTAEGLYFAFKKLKLKIQIHIVQTTACHPIVDGLEISPLRYASVEMTEKSLAGAIVDKVAHRKNEILKIIKNSHGFGYVANDEEIRNSIRLANKTSKIKLSPNSALSVVGLMQAIKLKKKFNGPIVCLVTGK